MATAEQGMSEETEQTANIVYCLDKGFVRLVDSMGTDSSIVQAARVSYGAGTKKVHQDRGLIRYLMRHHHTTPFEMVEYKFHIKLPIFVARQWIRHRTANVNEYSGRYSVMKEEFYVPDAAQIRTQSDVNKQGRSDERLPEADVRRILDQLERANRQAYGDYEDMLETGLAREMARINLPLSLYTEWYWKIDLHNLFHFLHLRLDAHAQYEIRVYAEAIAALIKDSVPFAWEAFEDFRLNARSFTRLELKVLKSILAGRNSAEPSDEALAEAGLSKREAHEFRAKLDFMNSLD